MNDYEIVKDFIRSPLETQYKNNGNALEKGDIDKKIRETQNLLSNNEALAKILGLEEGLTDSDYKRMASEFEAMFNVKMDRGLVIQGDEQQARDTTWWRDKVKIILQQENKIYYATRFRDFISRKLSPEVIKTLDDDTDSIMNNIGNPNDNRFDIFGMVVGHVQSGKTMNYSSLICKAADAGYKFIVIIAGDKNNLRNQTQKRINEYFIGKDALGNSVGVGISDKNDRGKMPISLTTQHKDFNKQDARTNSQGINFDNVITPIVLVIKKNYRTLENVIEWLKNQYNNSIAHPMLVIDDEADYASINTKDENDPTKINKLIRTLLNLFKKSSYIAYTATPFANIFINDESLEQDELSKDLFPSDFIYALDAPSNYFGAEKIFIDNKEKYIVEIDDYADKIPLKHRRYLVIDELPKSLCQAINTFCINCAIRHLRGQMGHNSMLVHMSRFVDTNRRIYFKIDEYLQKVKNDFRAYGKLDDSASQSQIIRDFCYLFENKFEFIEDFSVQEIIYKITEIIDTINVKEEHSKSRNRLEYRSDIAANVIAVGGMTLSRGFTLEGLSVSYFIRSTIFYDTLMQMGRWFGYRDNYDDLCKIYMPSEVSDNFTQIIGAVNELMDKFREMASIKQTPKDFGLEVKYCPDSLLQITARNKMRHTEKFQCMINFSGLSKEASRIYKDTNILRDNFHLLNDFVGSLSARFIKKESNYIARDIDKETILNFLKDFHIVDKYAPLMPIELIKSYVEQKDTAWDIIMFQGGGVQINVGGINTKKEIRTLNDRGKYFLINHGKISFAQNERCALNEQELQEIKQIIEYKRQNDELQKGDEMRLVRQRLTKPVLMLHIIEPKEPIKSCDEHIATFGVCFPYSNLYQTQCINYVVNSVKQKEILEESHYDEDNETFGDADE